jgi:hypothetical protein
VIAWAPTVAAASDVSATAAANADDRPVLERLAEAAQHSNSPYFALTAAGAVEPLEPMEKVEPCPQR